VKGHGPEVDQGHQEDLQELPEVGHVKRNLQVVDLLQVHQVDSGHGHHTENDLGPQEPGRHTDALSHHCIEHDHPEDAHLLVDWGQEVDHCLRKGQGLDHPKEKVNIENVLPYLYK